MRKDWDKTTFQKREQPADVLRGIESVFRDANPANFAKSLLERNRDHLLTQARSELMKQEHSVESQRLDLENVHLGYIESRRE